MVVIKFGWNLHSIIKQLHFDERFNSTKILHQIIATTKQTSEFFPFYIRNYYTLESAVFEFAANELGIYTIGCCVALFSFSLNICRIHHWRNSAKTNRPPVGRKTKTTGFIRSEYLVVRKMFLNIYP